MRYDAPEGYDSYTGERRADTDEESPDEGYSLAPTEERP